MQLKLIGVLFATGLLLGYTKGEFSFAHLLWVHTLELIQDVLAVIFVAWKIIQPLTLCLPLYWKLLVTNLVSHALSGNERNRILDAIQTTHKVVSTAFHLPVRITALELTVLAVCAVVFQELCSDYEVSHVQALFAQFLSMCVL